MSLAQALGLKQARDGIRELINQNKSIITVSRKNQVMNSKGDYVDDPYAVPTLKVLRCRVSHENVGTFGNQNIQGAMTSNLGRYILSDHHNEIKENDTFDLSGTRWRIGKVDRLYNFGDIIGYQAPLIEAITKGAIT